MRIGVDVGGTNTDAVLMDGRRVLATTKRPTTEDVSTGLLQAVEQVLSESGVAVSDIQAVMVGTTHFTNAFVERKNLLEVAVVRAALPACRGLPPLVDWPDDLLESVGRHPFPIKGGYEFDGREISPLDEQEVRETAREIRRRGLTSVAVSSVFAPVNTTMETRIAELFAEEHPEARVTLSSVIGRLGLLEREGAAIINAALVDLAERVVGSFESAFKELRLDVPFFLSQNDGTLMNAETAARYPVLTFASGPTNSMRGAAFLSGVSDALVVDIGGTTSDVGLLMSGYPRESALHVDIEGIRTNFRMPDILSVGLGGGSRIHGASTEDLRIGPDSVGFRLLDEALIFGGETLTTTDVAVASGYADIGDAGRLENLDSQRIEAAVDEIHRLVADAVDRVRISADELPLVLVGGGSVLVNRAIPGTSEVLKPEHAEVANAIGAAIAQVGGEVDRVFAYEELGRERALELAREEATELAIEAGADSETIQIVTVDELPLAYLPGGSVRIRVKAVGEMLG